MSGFVERKTRLELATPTLARLCSTTELYPHIHNYKNNFLILQEIKLKILKFFYLKKLKIL